MLAERACWRERDCRIRNRSEESRLGCSSIARREREHGAAVGPRTRISLESRRCLQENPRARPRSLSRSLDCLPYRLQILGSPTILRQIPRGKSCRLELADRAREGVFPSGRFADERKIKVSEVQVAPE